MNFSRGHVFCTFFVCRNQFTSCFEAAWLLSEAIQLQQVSSPVLAKRKSSRSSSRMLRTISRGNKTEEGEGETRGRVRSLTDVKKESFAAWCSLRTARQAHLARERFQSLTSQLHTPELAKTLPDKALADMPDFALLELCPGESVLGSLLSSCETLPVDLLVPSQQSVRPAGLTWFHVVSHAYSILIRCFWPPNLPSHTSTSSPPLPHTLTPSLHAKYHALASFLQQHCPLFSTSCSHPQPPPPPPPPLPLLALHHCTGYHDHRRGADSSLRLPPTPSRRRWRGHGGVVQTTSQLTAADCDESQGESGHHQRHGLGQRDKRARNGSGRYC